MTNRLAQDRKVQRRNRHRQSSNRAPEYEFDAALSFAGEDREHASRLARALKAKGYKVFYDKDFRGELWGKGQKEYERIYGPQSRFVIPFISESYTQKEWTLFEFESAKREAKNRNYDFLLPVRLDNARLLGLSDDVNYLRLGDLTIGEIASDFARKCGMPLGSGTADSTRMRTPLSTERLARLLSSEGRLVLGILMTSVLPLPLGNYKRVFPQLKWSAHCRRLSQAGLIKIVKDRIYLTKTAKACFDDPSEITDFHTRWIAALLPVRWHVDTAVMLAMHYLETGSLDDVVNTIADAAETTALGDWNRIYLGALQALTHKRAIRKLSEETRCRLYNSLGICLCNAGDNHQALAWFRKLGATAQPAAQNVWLGQGYLNRGVAYNNLGEPDKAARHYRKANRVWREGRRRHSCRSGQRQLGSVDYEHFAR